MRFGKHREQTTGNTITSREPSEWTEFEAWLFRSVVGVHHTDPANGKDAVFNAFFIELDEEKGIMVTPETASAEMAILREAFEGTYPHIFEAAIPKETRG